MATVHDLAAYIIDQHGPMSAMKLQKLAYYSQAWSITLHDAPLFSEEVLAWALGPVVYELFKKHRGRFVVDDWKWGDPSNLSKEQAELVDRVLLRYGRLSGDKLSELTHREKPWSETPPDTAISPNAMKSYYYLQDLDDNYKNPNKQAW